MKRLAQLVSLTMLLASWAGTVHAEPLVCPKSPSSTKGSDFHGRNLTHVNFAHQDLTNANFEGATLSATAFIKSTLVGANFRNAVFSADPGDEGAPNDFTLADLSQACFIGARFQAPTYFTFAKTSCTDFSQTDLTNGNAIFGALSADASCRPAFRASSMSCELLDEWRNLDLSGANLRSCTDQLSGRDFHGAKMPGVDFSEAVLDKVVFSGADLSSASFLHASVKHADFGSALLYGARFGHANLEEANLRDAFLTSDPAAGAHVPADFSGAHLKNANLAGAHLGGVGFDGASFYGSFNGVSPSFPCETDVSKCPGKATGFTCGCATASGATLIGTHFVGAYLYGVDFRGQTTLLDGVSFSDAVLVGSDFTGASFSKNAGAGGVPTTFASAHLQGVDLGGTNLTDTSLLGAFVDFGAPENMQIGNVLFVALGPQYTAFNGWPTPSQPICVQAAYGSFSKLPIDVPSMTCPDGSRGVAGCGPLASDGSNKKWRAASPIDHAPAPGWYQFAATFTPANPSGLCNGDNASQDW